MGHGHTKNGKRTKTHAAWHGLIQRCTNPNNPKYPIYGGRGISVCNRWRDFTNFLSDMGECPKGRTLDRIDVHGNYEPENCRWATPKEQANNKTNNRLLTLNGETRTSAEWAKFLNIPFVTLRMRLHRGWSVRDALTKPLRR